MINYAYLALFYTLRVSLNLAKKNLVNESKADRYMYYFFVTSLHGTFRGRASQQLR